eukprot:5921815-Lingulodinium_polyedra.AAC.1
MIVREGAEAKKEAGIPGGCQGIAGKAVRKAARGGKFGGGVRLGAEHWWRELRAGCLHGGWTERGSIPGSKEEAQQREMAEGAREASG